MNAKRTLVAALLLIAVAPLSGRTALATNMGFRFNKGIAPLGVPFPVGQNWVALPFTNIYATAQDVCAALGLTPGIGVVRQVDPGTGVTTSHTCGNAGPFNLVPARCVLILNNVPTAGILAGSQPPGATYTIAPQTVPFPRGFNLFTVPYNSTACTAEDLCTQIGLPAGATIRRLNSATGVQQSHSCGGAGAFNLVLGECVAIQYVGPPISFMLPHF